MNKRRRLQRRACLLQDVLPLAPERRRPVGLSHPKPIHSLYWKSPGWTKL